VRAKEDSFHWRKTILNSGSPTTSASPGTRDR
jgi:hypothetical protein